MIRLLSCAMIVIFALPSVLFAHGSLEDLTKPIEGRSMSELVVSRSAGEQEGQEG
jgi:hypothetical protein